MNYWSLALEVLLPIPMETSVFVASLFRVASLWLMGYLPQKPTKIFCSGFRKPWDTPQKIGIPDFCEKFLVFLITRFHCEPLAEIS
jgi:hypothetical protein